MTTNPEGAQPTLDLKPNDPTPETPAPAPAAPAPAAEPPKAEAPDPELEAKLAKLEALEAAEKKRQEEKLSQAEKVAKREAELALREQEIELKAAGIPTDIVRDLRAGPKEGEDVAKWAARIGKAWEKLIPKAAPAPGGRAVNPVGPPAPAQKADAIKQSNDRARARVRQMQGLPALKT